MVELVLLMLGSVGIIAGAAAIRLAEATRWRESLTTYDLTFPRDLDASAVTAFITGLSGLVAPRGKRAFAQRAVVFEVVADATGITHRLLVPDELASAVTSNLQATLPQATLDPKPLSAVMRPTVAGELRLRDAHQTLRTDNAEALAASILASLQPKNDERVTVQWIISPAGPVSSGMPSSSVLPQLLQLNVAKKVRDPGLERAVKVKRAEALFHATVRLGVTADPPRATQLLRQLTGAFHVANAPGAHLERRNVSSAAVARRMVDRRPPLFGYAAALNAAELTGLVAFPIGSPQLVGLKRGGCKRLMPPHDLPTTGRIVGRSNYPGIDRVLAQHGSDGLRHCQVLGPSGVGKSTLLCNLILSDINSNRGVVVVDPKGDLVADVLDRVPEHRLDDVVILDPTDDERPVGLNVLAHRGHDSELVVEQVVSIFHQLYGSQLGPRSRDVLHATLLALVRFPGMTLCEIGLVLTDQTFRRRLTKNLNDPVGLEPFFQSYEALSEGERAQWIAPLANKVRPLLLRERIRNCIGQGNPLFNFDDALRDGRIVLINLRRGLLGDDAAALIGAMVIAQLWQSVSRRAGEPASSRKQTMAYIDEAGDFMALPTNLADLLVTARGLALGLVLSHQHLAQLTPQVRSAMLANCASRILFQLSAADAQTMAKELTPYLSAADLQQLGPYEIVAQLAVGARTAAPATGVTFPLPPSLGSAEVALNRSRARYGRPRAEVEAELRERHEPRRGGGGRIGRIE